MSPVNASRLKLGIRRLSIAIPRIKKKQKQNKTRMSTKYIVSQCSLIFNSSCSSIFFKLPPHMICSFMSPSAHFMAQMCFRHVETRVCDLCSAFQGNERSCFAWPWLKSTVNTPTVVVLGLPGLHSAAKLSTLGLTQFYAEIQHMSLLDSRWSWK